MDDEELEEDSEIIIEGTLESKSYIEMTLEVLENCGIKIKNNNK